jgi:hypothetical protein
MCLLTFILVFLFFNYVFIHFQLDVRMTDPDDHILANFDVEYSRELDNLKMKTLK